MYRLSLFNKNRKKWKPFSDSVKNLTLYINNSIYAY